MSSIEPAIEPAEPREVALPESALPEPALPDATLPKVSMTPPAHCKNCNAVLLGRYCVNCSQAADVHVPSTAELLHEMVEGLTHSDSRLWRTLTLLWFKPGKLTQEYVAGRRVAYLPPFRLYLILSIVFFLVASFMPSGQIIQFDEAKSHAASSTPRVTGCQDLDFDTLTSNLQWNQRIKRACQEVSRDNGENWAHVAVSAMPKAMFIFLPLIAFLHMLLYWSPRYRYAEHLLFFVHLHAFYFSLAIVIACAINTAHAWPRFNGVSGILQTLLGWCLPIYSLLAMRRVFGRSWPGTLFKAVVLFFVYSIALGFTLAGVFVYAALQL
jgi:uncharacterized membrane protein